MFGFSKKDREEYQKGEAIEYALDLFLNEFRIALGTTANVYNVNAYPSGDGLKEERFLVVILASAHWISGDLNAEKSTTKKALKKYFSAFPDGDEAFRMALNPEIYNRHTDLAEKTIYAWHLIYNHQDEGMKIDREKVMMSLAQVYLGL